LGHWTITGQGRSKIDRSLTNEETECPKAFV